MTNENSIGPIEEGVAYTGTEERKIHIESDSNASFLRAARAGNVEKIQEYIKGSIDINTSNANGLNALHLASKEGHVTVVQELLKKGANVNAATKKGNTALHIASLAGQEEVAKLLIRGGANPNVQSQNGFTPLYMAAQENHDNVVKFLLANAANQSIATEDGFTPLAVALQQGHDKVVAVLLENDAKGRVRLPALHIAAKKDDCKAAALLLQNDHDPDVTSKSGFTPLHIAAHYGNESIAVLLLEKNADVNFSAKHQITPLHVAAKWGKSNMVTLLIDKKAKIDASTRDGLTPLHCAARSGHDSVVDLLLEKGAPITAKTKNGLTPLHMASQGDHVDSARILLYHKAPVDDVTVDYLTALHVGAHCGHVRVAKLLLDRKADPNSRALNGFTPLHIACKKNRIKVVELLLKHGASIEATTESGLTPLHVASFMGCMNIVLYLIQHGANPDVPTVRGETPLHLAARANQSDIIRILLRNGAHVDASAREQQTPLHIAARLGNVDIVGLLLQHGAAVDATTKDMYTALHIAAKEGQEEVASVLLDNGASLTSTTKKGFTPLHLAAKYGNIKVARLLLQKDAPVDAQGKNGVTPLHVAAHYDHVNVALLLLDKGAFPHATAKNGYTPLHIAAKKNQMDIATTLLEYGAKPSAESKAGFTPLHLASQEGHTDITSLLIEHHGDVNATAKNGLTPLHLCAQEDKVNVAAVLSKNGAKTDPPTKAGYTPLHVACHFGQINMIRFLLQHGADVNATTSHGYTPLHQAAQQGHTLIINLLLEHKASPNTTTKQGQTALSIAQRLGYISVVETLKIVTETIVTTTTTTVTEEKYKVVAPETMQEAFMSDSEDEGAEDTMLGGDQSLHYMTTDELKALADDNTLGIDVTRDERGADSNLLAPLTAEEDHLTPLHMSHNESTFSTSIAADNVDLARAPVHAGKLKWKTFLVSFMVDARGGAMRGCRHSGVRVIIPPRRAPMPMRITCRFLRKEKLACPPPLMEGEACASRILEVGPSQAKFLGPVILEVPHFASLRGREREIIILRSDNGETWREHQLEASEDVVHDVFNESFEGEELSALDDLSTNRITRILTTDFPQYFAVITRVRQEVHAIGPEGGMVSSTVVPQVQAIFPEGALTKKIKVGLQAHPIAPELVSKLLGNRVAVSPIVTVEPRRRKFHKSITLTIPVPQAATKGMINQYSGDAPTLRLLCSITGGTTKAQWEDVTGSTPLTFVNDCVSFTTTVSARFWLMDCRQIHDATKFATELYREAIHVPFMAKFVVFAKRRDPLEAQLRVFCMTDDKEDKTLESQEHFTEVAKSRDVEVLEGKLQYLEFAGNLIPVTKSGEQLSFPFQAFRENRLPFTIRVKDTHQEPMGRVAFMREARVGRGEPPQAPICNLNIVLPEPDLTPTTELVTLEKKYGFVQETSLAKPELIHKADLRLSDIAKELGNDWIALALQLDLPESDINTIRLENPHDTTEQGLQMLRYWLHRPGSKANGNFLEKGLRKINREDIVNQCMFNVELVTDDVEKAVAKVHLDQSGFDTFKEELGPSRDASLRRDQSLNGTFDEQDIMKEAESAAETSSESSDKDALFRTEMRYSGKVSKKAAERIPSNKSFEEGPETLIQGQPHLQRQGTNGQSDLSGHEDDRSEPTAATLSSEATAEMDVSSLEDKSQAETHVEKQAHHLNFMGRKQNVSRSVKPAPTRYKTSKNAFSSMKALKQSKQTDRKVSFSTNEWTMTLPASNKKRRKLITRRNSWPPDSPRKLNVRKKYQQRLKSKDYPEPFWSNTLEWLVMRCAPESLRSVPLARLPEFDDLITVTIKSFQPRMTREAVSPPKEPVKLRNFNYAEKQGTDSIGFYFVKNPKRISSNPKEYMKKLKERCSSENRPFHNVQNHNTSTFSVKTPQETIFRKGYYDPEVESQIVSISPRAASVVVEEIEIFERDLEDNVRGRIHSQYESSLFPNSRTPPIRPLRSSNSDSLGDVLIDSAVHEFHENLAHIKHKMPLKQLWNKENVVRSNANISESKFIPYDRQRVMSGIQIKKEQKSAYKTVQNNSKQFTTNINEQMISQLPKDIQGGKMNIPQSVAEDTAGKQIDHSTQSKCAANEPYSHSSQSDACASSSTSDMSYGSRGLPTSQCFEKDVKGNVLVDKELPKTKKNPLEDSSSNQLQDKTVLESSTSVPPKSSHKHVLPAEVLGYNFLKTLSDRAELQEPTQPAPFPASVIGHAFLTTLAEQKNKLMNPPEKMDVTSDVGLSFLRNLFGDSTATKQDIPASVIGQAFVKSLLSAEHAPEENIEKIFTVGEQSTLIDSTKQGEFEKQTTQISRQIPTTANNPESLEPIPSAVISQTFLKSLIEQADTKTTDEMKSQTIPANVLGQSFLKSILDQTYGVVPVPHSTSESISPNSIPSHVIGQSFIKALIEETSEPNLTSADSGDAFPAAVIGQTFIKSLLQEHSLEEQLHADLPSTISGIHQSSPLQQQSGPKLIPAPVLSQAFMKTLVDERRHSDDSKPEAIPSSVIGQSFLKSLVEAEQQSSKFSAPVGAPNIPASVLGQAFLKSLIEQDNSSSTESPSKPLPSSVIGHSFLKSLMESNEIASSDALTPIPSSVVGQAFLKTLVESNVSVQEEISKPIPSPVVGQAFLKTLIAETASQSKEKSENPLPAVVVGQAFLKSLISENPHETKENVEKPVPAAVVGQTFLKTLLEPHATPCDSDSKASTGQELVIPSSVLCQTFLKDLVHHTSTSSTATASEESVPSSTADPAIPASVIGSAFLKILSGQSDERTIQDRSSVSTTLDESSAVPANVVGQAFLKTLLSMSSELASQEPSAETRLSSTTTKDDFGNGSENGNHHDSLAASASFDDEIIIPPPPEFSGIGDEPSSSADVDPNILGELLSYTRMMHSVLENMKETTESSPEKPEHGD